MSRAVALTVVKAIDAEVSKRGVSVSQVLKEIGVGPAFYLRLRDDNHVMRDATVRKLRVWLSRKR